MLEYPYALMMFLFIAAQLQDIHVGLYQSKGIVAPFDVIVVRALLKLAMILAAVYVGLN